MARSSSNIRVFVEFEKHTVFAGEDVECTITFKNVNRPSLLQRPSQHLSGRRASIQNKEIPERSLPPAATSKITHTDLQQPQIHSQPLQHSIPSGHRPVLSLDVNQNVSQILATSEPATLNDSSTRTTPKHRRRISIISIASDGGESPRGLESSPKSTRASYSHTRSISLHNVTGRYGNQNPSTAFRSVTQPSPLSETTNLATLQEIPKSSAQNGVAAKPFISNDKSSGIRPHNRRHSTAPQQRRPPFGESRTSPNLSFGLDEASLARSSRSNSPMASEAVVPLKPQTAEAVERTQSPSPRLPENMPTTSLPLHRIASLASAEGTPRSSGEFYSASNHSDETLASEYPFRAISRLTELSGLSKPFIDPLLERQQGSETLMMGFAKISGSFILDGSLVNPAPFEEVKRKGVLGSQGGGGVVGVEKSSRQAGLFGSLGWGSIGESIGGILGNNELSSIKEMRGQASSKSIPLLSTPQSILFVDLRLAPGESKAFKYSFTLPNGLPPTHRGRAMKISYHLVIGTQRPASLKSQKRIRHVEVPFRVFGGINQQGEPLGHDLMSPYIILKDQARTSTVDESIMKLPASDTTSLKSGHSRNPKQDDVGAQDFQKYVAALLLNSKSKNNHILLSPSEPTNTHLLPSNPQSPLSATSPTSPPHAPALPPVLDNEALIDHAIHISTRPSASNPTQSPTHFTITRASIPVATLLLQRPAFRLGDSLTAVLDFSPPLTSTGPNLPTYAVSLTLESYEFVSPSLSLRSASSIERSTRRVWASDIRCVLWADRIGVHWQIPSASAAGSASLSSGSAAGTIVPGMPSGGGPTPEFLTSGVGLQWRIRLELVVAQQPEPLDAPPADRDDAAPDNEDAAENALLAASAARADVQAGITPRAEELLEEVARDDRGRLLAAMENLPCETFEVCIPIRVYGAVAESRSSRETKAATIGLAV